MSVFRSERRGDAEAAAVVTEVEGEIRDFIRRDVSYLRRPREANADTGAVDSINALIQRVSGASVDEIDRVISELQHVRDTLRREGERVQREISGYAGLSQAAMASMKVIAENLQQWKAPSIQSNGNGG
jgi:hypothetical protein